jgi:peptide-methionine (S)-S-oxide reductase
MTRILNIVLLTSFIFPLFSCGTKSKSQEKNEIIINAADTAGMKKAVFASGCFWCVEAIFESVEGVGEVISGYSGGTAESANYSAVSSGMSKHAEAVEIYYDPSKISYKTLLTVFFDSHDPTTLNRQGPDYGFQYRSAIFYANEEEKLAAQAIR